MLEKFRLDVKAIKIANSGEESISKTIEELLELNDKIPARTGKEIAIVTEKQLDKDKYMNRDSRGEISDVTEIQLTPDREKTPDPDVIEVKLNKTDTVNGGHKDSESESYLKKKERGHSAVPLVWLDVYKKEDDRKKIDKGQMSKKLKPIKK
jgi:hypothetical protein